MYDGEVILTVFSVVPCGRLAPEHIFPTSLNDGYAALKWVILNASLYWSTSLDEDGIILGGCSAGGNLAASAALQARDDPFFKKYQVKLRGQLHQMPMTIHPDAKPEETSTTTSYQPIVRFRMLLRKNKDSPLVNTSHHLKALEYYDAPSNNPEVSLLLAPRHSGLPPTYFQVCGNDALRDEGLLYEQILRESGVQIKINIYPGLPHGGGHFHLYNLPISIKYRRDIIEGTKWLLELKHY
ncbi:alpha/beta hydrolase fold-domain-containing protein [Abortiporus biennis]|nr:alpha/beta hydrolase fold-domain-containing protein [Abortiporus biennis]